MTALLEYVGRGRPAIQVTQTQSQEWGKVSFIHSHLDLHIQQTPPILEYFTLHDTPDLTSKNPLAPFPHLRGSRFRFIKALGLFFDASGYRSHFKYHHDNTRTTDTRVVQPYALHPTLPLRVTTGSVDFNLLSTALNPSPTPYHLTPYNLQSTNLYLQSRLHPILLHL